MKFSVKEKLLICFKYQFSLRVFKNRLNQIKDKIIDGLLSLVKGIIYLFDGLIFSPIQTAWQFSVGFLIIALTIKDWEAEKIKNAFSKKN